MKTTLFCAQFSAASSYLLVSVFIGLTNARSLHAQVPVLVPIPTYDYYGSFAYSRSTGVWGRSTNFLDQYNAERGAVQACEARSNAGDCIPVYTITNSCASLARDSDGYLAAARNTYRAKAEYFALKDCHDRGGRGCEVLHTFCTDR